VKTSGEQQDQHDPEPKARHTDAEQAEYGSYVIHDRVWSHSGEDPQRNGDSGRDNGGKKSELQRSRQALPDEVEHGPVETERSPEVALRRVYDEPEVLDVKRLVQPPPLPRLGHVRRSCFCGQQQRRRIPWRRLQEPEHEQRDQQEHRERADQSTNQILDHASRVWFSPFWLAKRHLGLGYRCGMAAIASIS